MIQEKDFLYRVPVKNALVTAPGQQVRNPEILVDVEGGEFMRGNILDANSTNKLINQSVKDAVDNKLVESGYVIKELLQAETEARTKGDEDLGAKIKAEQTRAEGAESNLQTAINTKADATALNNYVLTTALNQQINTLNTAISAKQNAGNYIEYSSKGDDGYHLNDQVVSEYPFVCKESNSSHGAITSMDVSGFNIYDIGGSASIGSFSLDFTRGSATVSYTAVGIDVADQPTSVPLTNSTFKPISDFVLKTELPEASIDMLSYGVEWDVTVADPTCTRIGNPLLHKSLPVQSAYKGCIVKDGKLRYFLNPNDWSKKENGQTANLDGTDGDVMIRTPRFYGKSGSNGNKRWVRISTIQIDASWTEIPEMFISAYSNTIYTDGDTTKVASVVSTDTKYRGGGRRSAYDEYLSTDQFKTDLGKPVSNISRATMRTYATAAGQELLCYEFYKWIFYWNYVIEYANFNSQKEFNSELTSDGYHQGGLGSGLTAWSWDKWNTYNENCAITPCGYTNEFGNFSGIKAIQIQSSEKTLYANRWRGFENPFGDIWINLDGIVIKRNSAGEDSFVYTTSDSSSFTDKISETYTTKEIAQDGWIKEFNLGETAEIVPSLVGGSESTYKCDYHQCATSSTDNRTLLVGGSAHNGGTAGLGSFYSHNGVGTARTNVGFRTVIRS